MSDEKVMPASPPVLDDDADAPSTHGRRAGIEDSIAAFDGYGVVPRDRVRAAVEDAYTRGHADGVREEREAIENRLREVAAHYRPGTDGRNTFVMVADWVSARAGKTK